jgi:hypothetical protein
MTTEAITRVVLTKSPLCNESDILFSTFPGIIKMNDNAR